MADPGEACDGTDLGGASCLTLGYYDGSLTCSGNCSLELTSCAAAGRCGDGILQGSEECDDGNELDGDGCEICRILEFQVDPFEGSWYSHQPAVTMDAAGSVQVVFTFLDALDVDPYTIAYCRIFPEGWIGSGEFVFLPFPLGDMPSRTGFGRPDAVLVNGTQGEFRSLLVFQECDEDLSCPHALDGSGTGIFRVETPVYETPPVSRVNSFTAGNQARPRIAARWSGESVVVWQSDGQDGSGWGVFAQPFTRDGTALGPEIAVNETTTGDQLVPDVAMLGDGGFMVVWESWDEGQVNQGVFVRRFDEQGLALGGEARVAQATPLDPGQAAPRIAAGPDGLVVVWQAWAEDGDGWGVFGRAFSADGAPAGGDLALAEEWQGDQAHPAVAIDGAGSFVAVWEDQSSGEWYVRGRRFDSAGQPLGGEIEVSRKAMDSHYGYPDIAAGPDGRFVVVWGAIRAQRFLPDGTPIGLAPW